MLNCSKSTLRVRHYDFTFEAALSVADLLLSCFTCLRGHPFMTPHTEGGRGQAQVDACGPGVRGVQPHVDVHTEN